MTDRRLNGCHPREGVVTDYMCRCGHLSVKHSYCKYECHAEGCGCELYEVQP